MKRAEELGVDLPQLSLADLQAFSPLVGEDVFSVLTVEGSLAARKPYRRHGTGSGTAAITRARNRL